MAEAISVDPRAARLNSVTESGQICTDLLYQALPVLHEVCGRVKGMIITLVEQTDERIWDLGLVDIESLCCKLDIEGVFYRRYNSSNLSLHGGGSDF